MHYPRSTSRQYVWFRSVDLSRSYAVMPESRHSGSSVALNPCVLETYGLSFGGTQRRYRWICQSVSRCIRVRLSTFPPFIRICFSDHSLTQPARARTRVCSHNRLWSSTRLLFCVDQIKLNRSSCHHNEEHSANPLASLMTRPTDKFSAFSSTCARCNWIPYNRRYAFSYAVLNWRIHILSDNTS